MLMKSFIVTLLLIAGMIAFGASRFQKASHARAVPRESAKAPSDNLEVSFRAQTHQTKSGPTIQLRWNASAEPIRRSAYAFLYIYDSGIPQKLLLGRRTLDSGSTQYSPAGDEITFHLILEKGRPAGEFLLVLLGSPERKSSGLESHR